jgi:FtsP/CotA-like multicopper oxidase with cupredoxin domain
MTKIRSKWAATGVGAAMVAAIAAVAPLPGNTISAQSGNDGSGLICTESTSSPGVASFALKALDGRILAPDGNTVYMWSYSAGAGSFQYPGPALCVNAGDEVTVTLKNKLPVATSILFEGVEGVRADDEPASVEVDGTGRLTSLIQSVDPNQSITYTFPAPPPGTYLYQSGTDHLLQREMGLHGALIVRPDGYTETNRTVYGDPNSSYDVSQEYMHLLSQVDPSLHITVEQGGAPDFSQYRPRYFFINGRSFPDTIAPNNAPWLPNQPYGSLVHVKAIGQGQNLPSVIRYLNAGPVNVPFHPHSNHEEVIGIDARPLIVPGTDPDPDVVASLDRFAIDVQSGQTVEARFSWTNTTWDGGNVEQVPDQRNLQDGGYWSGEILLGDQGIKPTGGDAFNICGEYYHVAHNHALNMATNYGAAMGGQLTLVRVDPQSGC